MGFTNFSFYDDDEDNIAIAKEFAKNNSYVVMNANLIKKKWIPQFEAFNWNKVHD